MKTLLAAAVLALLLAPHGAHAQTEPSVGDRVRVRKGDGAVHVGKVEHVSPLELVLAEPTGTRTLPWQDIVRIERSSGIGRRFWRNFAITVVVAGGVGGTLSAVAWSPCRETGLFACLLEPDSRSQAFQLGMVVGGLVGIPLGLVVGHAVQSERWRPMRVPSASPVALGVTTDGGRGLGVRVSIPLGGHAP